MSREAVVAAVEDHQKLTEEIEQTERQIFDLEQFYLSETSRYGNVLRGWRRDSEGGLVLTTQCDSLTSAPSVHTETSAEALVAHENVMTSKVCLVLPSKPCNYIVSPRTRTSTPFPRLPTNVAAKTIFALLDDIASAGGVRVGAGATGREEQKECEGEGLIPCTHPHR